MFAELKRERDARVSPEQVEWIRDLNACIGVEAYLWRPSDVATVMTVLR